jgi:hypothetical protein
MFSEIKTLFKRKSHGGERPSHTPVKVKTKRRRSSDPLGGLSELAIPPPIQNRQDSAFYHHHTLEDNIESNARGEDPDEADADEDILVRHHTLEENIQLAQQLSQEIKRQSLELRHLSHYNGQEKISSG